MTEKITRQEKLNLANRIRLDKNLSPATRLVGLHIADHINTKRGYAWIPQEKIARDLGLGERTVRRLVKDLARHFDIDRSRRQHEYRPPTPAKMAGITPATPAKMATTPAKMAAHPSYILLNILLRK